jgi:lysophospholipase L1-like esterase
VFRIVALGGSTTYGISLPMNRTYPAQLQQILRDEYGYTQVEVINAGVIAYNSWDLLAEFEYRVLDLNPDMVIVYEGINDVVARLVDPRYYNGANPARGTWRTDYPALSPSVLTAFWRSSSAGCRIQAR